MILETHKILGKAKAYIQDIETETPQAAAFATIHNEQQEPQFSYMITPRQNQAPYRQQFLSNPRPGPQIRPYSPNFTPRRFNRPFAQRAPYTNQRAPYTNQRAPSPTIKYCHLCNVLGLPPYIYKSHDIGQMSCPSISKQEKQMRVTNQLNALHIDDYEQDDNLLADLGYATEPIVEEEQVKLDNFDNFMAKKN